MKKYVQLILALVIVAAIFWMAKAGIAWAGGLPTPQQQPPLFSQPVSAQDSINPAPPALSIDITEGGIYNIGGICLLDVEYKDADVKNQADAEVPLEQSRQVAFPGYGKLFFPGCHIVHYKDNEVVSEASSQDGNWKVCFGNDPDMEQVQIYYVYYNDEPINGGVWIPLVSYFEDNNNLVCASAPYTGVYMPAGKPPEAPGQSPGKDTASYSNEFDGTVPKPPRKVNITKPGTYSVGAICSAIIDYYIPGLDDNLHIQFPTQNTEVVPFNADNGDLLYLPGCHFLHFREGRVKDLMTPEEGDWKICFAARPGKEMTIYFYRDNNTEVIPAWEPLETTIENGLACAPVADYSGVYAPAGR